MGTKSSQSLQGVYEIRCRVNKRVYVGESINHLARFHNHKTLLRGGMHFNKRLQEDFNTYGEDAFDFVFCEQCGSRSELLDLERQYIQRNFATVEVYNKRNMEEKEVYKTRSIEEKDSFQSKPVNFYLPEDVLLFISEQAKQKNRSASNFLTTLIRELRDGAKDE